jgi:hypothetical protein
MAGKLSTKIVHNNQFHHVGKISVRAASMLSMSIIRANDFPAT